MTKTLLVIDDEQYIVNAIRRSLRGLDIDILAAYCGYTGVELAINNDVDLIIIDWRMPDISGTVAAALIKEHLGDKMPTIIGLTGSNDEELGDEDKEIVRAWFSKTDSLTGIADLIERFI